MIKMCVCQIERETGEIESATIRRRIKDGATIKQILKNKTEREREREDSTRIAVRFLKRAKSSIESATIRRIIKDGQRLNMC
jgi:hypothetical protein